MKRRDLLKYGTEALVVTALGVGAVQVSARSDKSPRIIRPPRTKSESELLGECIKCGRCIQECPVDALAFAGIGDGLLRSGTPKIAPEAAGCIAWDEPCLECIHVCPTEALGPLRTEENDILTDEVIGRAQIDDTLCINCNNCYPVCPVDAVRAEGVDDRSTFSIDYEACVGCGKCIAICPVEGKAVDLFPPDAEPEYPIRMGDPN